MTEAKKENAIRYRQTLDLAPAVIYLKDKQGRYTFINRRFEVLSGYSEAQVLGRTDFDLFPEAVARNSAENDRKVLESGIPLEIEEFGPVDGRMHIFLSAKFPIYNDSGEIIELCGISTDITARKTAEQSLIESEERFRVALEANPDPVVLCDRDQHIIYSNPAFPGFSVGRHRRSKAGNWNNSSPRRIVPRWPDGLRPSGTRPTCRTSRRVTSPGMRICERS